MIGFVEEADVPAQIVACRGIGQRVEVARSLRGWLRETARAAYNEGLSRMWQISDTYLQQIEYGEAVPSRFTVDRLAEIYGVSRGWLADGEVKTVGSLDFTAAGQAALALRNIGWRQ